jgi:hypothetical protein
MFICSVVEMTDDLRFQSELFNLLPHIYNEILHVLERAVLKHVAEIYVGKKNIKAPLVGQ